MARRPLVSVIVSAYQAAPWLERTLQSALAQTVRDIEVIAVDNGSTDDTWVVITRMAAGDARIRPIRIHGNRGPAAGRNAALRVAAGDFVAPLDADDLWRPEKLERQLDRAAGCGTGISAVYSWWSYVDAEGFTLPGRGGNATWQGDVYARLIMGNFIGPSSVPLMRRTLVEQAGGYDEGLYAHEDKALYLALAERGDFVAVPECLVGYTYRPDSLSHDVLALEQCHRLVHAWARQRHPELPLWLFRWADANFAWWRMFRHLRNGDPVRAAAAGTAVLALDPGFVLRGTAAATLRRLFRRHGDDDGAPPRGPHLLDPATVTLALATDANGFDRWRDDRVGGLRIRRPPSPGLVQGPTEALFGQPV